MVSRRAQNQLEAFTTAEHATKEQDSYSVAPMVERWRRPTGDGIKFNWDAALSREGSTMGMGIIARDNAGNMVAATCCSKSVTIDPTCYVNA